MPKGGVSATPLYETVGGADVTGRKPLCGRRSKYPPPEATYVADAATVWAMVTCWSQAGRTMCVQ